MTEIILHVYDVTNTPHENANAIIMRVNNVTRDFSMGGVFHGAVEIGGREWSYGYCEVGSGVYACLPKLNPQYTYRESIPLGMTGLSQSSISDLLLRLRDEWPGYKYDLLGRNCCHFCESLCDDLGVGPVPGWLNRFAYGAESTVQVIQGGYDALSWLGGHIQGAWINAVNAVQQVLPPEDGAAISKDGVLEAPVSQNRPTSAQARRTQGNAVGAVPVGLQSSDRPSPATPTGVL